MALALGGRTVAELEDVITPGEVDEWMTFDTIMPLGLRGQYWQAGLIASAILNVNRDPSKSQPFKPEDFIPSFEATKPLPKKEAADAVKAAFLETFGDRVKDGGSD